MSTAETMLQTEKLVLKRLRQIIQDAFSFRLNFCEIRLSIPSAHCLIKLLIRRFSVTGTTKPRKISYYLSASTKAPFWEGEEKRGATTCMHFHVNHIKGKPTSRVSEPLFIR